MNFSLSPAGSVATESASDFFGIGQPQDPGILDDPTTGGDTVDIGKADHVSPEDKLFGPKDFTLKFVNEDDESDDDEDKDDETKDDDFDGDDDKSEEELRADLHRLYNVQAAIRTHGLDAATESFVTNTFGLRLPGSVPGLESYGVPTVMSAEDLDQAIEHRIVSLQAAVRDRMAGI